MNNNGVSGPLTELDALLAAGNIAAARKALLVLPQADRDILRERIGAAAFDRLYRSTQTTRRSKRGRVILIHGIMGSKLCSIDKSGDEDHVWVNYFRLAFGRIADFRLDANGNQADPNYSVETRGLLEEYFPTILELDAEWNVKPFAFDWRLDIDISAQLLRDTIEQWANGEPVHIVAHSMGGLVSRRFLQRYPQTWLAMADPDNLKRGGRLIMLGTPNRGSFAIPLTLTGEEKTLKKLEWLDQKHDMPELLAIVNSFIGSYQMLPSPNLSFGDDRAKLFDANRWGAFPVPQAQLDRGRRFQQELHDVLSPERLLYVAGYDQATPARIKIDGPGLFSYQETRAGDGRVPHDLGLLPGVATYFVREVHGDLQKNDTVLSAIHELLETGKTDKLETQISLSRSVAAKAPWRQASEFEAVPDDFKALVGPASRSSRATRQASPRVQAQVERLLLSDRAATDTGADKAGRRAPPGKLVTKVAAPVPSIALEVVWADIGQVDGDILACGHYQGVHPQNAELALDKLVSGPKPAGAVADDWLVITSQTRRGIMRGALGDVNFFPLPKQGNRQRTVAIAGMGHPGSFGRPELRTLAKTLTNAVIGLPQVTTVNTVLIGSGAGNMSIRACLESLLQGLGDAMGELKSPSTIAKVRIVERNMGQALRIHQALQELARPAKETKKSPLTELTEGRIALRIPEQMGEAAGGIIGQNFSLALFLAATAGDTSKKDSPGSRSVNTLLRRMPGTRAAREGVQNDLMQLAKDFTRLPKEPKQGKSAWEQLVQAALTLDIEIRREPDDPDAIPTRVSFVRDANGLRIAAITNTAVTPERVTAYDWTLVDQLIEDMTDPEPERLSGLSRMLLRFLMPRDFRETIEQAPSMVIEVDRNTARVHWEMMAERVADDIDREPLGLKIPLARQLRTAYSPPPARQRQRNKRLRALVIGDPGDPQQKHDLPGAREEALAVVKLLQDRDVDVEVLIGAPNAKSPGFACATRLEVLRFLMGGGFDLLHYAGHGDFDADDPAGRAGWVFHDGLLTARELERVDTMPNLVVANACLSGLLSNRTTSGKGTSPGRGTDADLVAGLADEFFRRGVRNYVGTAWEVNDVGAIKFATELYTALLPGPANEVNNATLTLGRAVLKARQSLRREESSFGVLWGAYQLYGDPNFRLVG